MLDPVRASRVRILGFDVDGVLTDNAVFVGEVAGTPVELKRFDIQDGLGHRLLAHAGLEVIWVSGRQSRATTIRGMELGIKVVLQVPADGKVAAIQQVLDARGLEWDALAFVGDDLADVPVLERCGLPIAVSNAVPHVKRLAAHVTTAAGGHGAVREVIDALLDARGELEQAMATYRTHADRAS